MGDRQKTNVEIDIRHSHRQSWREESGDTHVIFKMSREDDATYDCTQKVNENNEAHTEATEPAQFREENEFTQVVDRRVDPSTTLRQKNRPPLRGNSVRESIRRELQLIRWEVLHKERSEISIFSKRKEILLVQRIHMVFRVFVNDSVGDDYRATFIRCPNTVQRETTWKASHRPE